MRFIPLRAKSGRMGFLMEKVRKTRKLPEQIADRLREMIIQEEMKTGMKLPAEGELV